MGTFKGLFGMLIFVVTSVSCALGPDPEEPGGLEFLPTFVVESADEPFRAPSVGDAGSSVLAADGLFLPCVPAANGPLSCPGRLHKDYCSYFGGPNGEPADSCGLCACSWCQTEPVWSTSGCRARYGDLP